MNSRLYCMLVLVGLANGLPVNGAPAPERTTRPGMARTESRLHAAGSDYVLQPQYYDKSYKDYYVVMAKNENSDEEK